jgi:hypothetical protein
MLAPTGTFPSIFNTYTTGIEYFPPNLKSAVENSIGHQIAGRIVEKN